jgi:hypothetical protein
MSFDYSKSAQTSLRLLTRFGQTVTRKDIVTGAYNPATGTAAQTTTTTSRIGAEMPLDDGQTTIAGTVIESTSVQLYLDATGEVKTTDRYVIGGKQYTVKSFTTIRPAGTAVLNILHLVAA